MESCGDEGWGLSSLVDVLAQGEHQLRQLDACLDEHSPVEQKKQLVRQAQAAFKQAISMAKAFECDRPRLAAAAADESPRSNSGGSFNSDRAFKEQERREMCKKRKTLPKWTSQVRVPLGAAGGADGLEDGYNWRKYGQKDILGAKHPRAYFRCTHRNTAGCVAMKQVQRSDDDPAVFVITYRGEHTCLQKPQKLSSSSPINQEAEQDQQLHLSFQTGLKVKTEGLSLEDGDRNSPFSFPSTPVSSFMSENNLLSSPPPRVIENSRFAGGFPPPFISPTTPESKYFSMSPWRVGSYGGEADLADVVSAVTSANNSSSAMDVAPFMLDSAGFDPALSFDESSFFHDL
ncbi:putative WRKY transcription factor 41 [Canna indica]|uniref:WRKY transcription factor 41 n=1 Tax=Canna indica TaxID=4628 RepID=A0AAQ3KYT0_9LILI|nr:putative WRKY transcription factor 41 [Canna indica]